MKTATSIVLLLSALLALFAFAPVVSAQPDTTGHLTVDGALLSHSSSSEAIARIGIGFEFSGWRVGGSYASAAEITPNPPDVGTTELSEWMVFGLREVLSRSIHVRAGLGVGSCDLVRSGGFGGTTRRMSGPFADLIAEAGGEGRHIAVGLAYHRRLSRYFPDDLVGVYLRY